MRYLAHAGATILTEIKNVQRSVWNPIKTIDDITYSWRINADNTYDVIAGPFNDRGEALVTAKQMYVTLIYSMLWGNIRVSNDGCSSYETTLSFDAYNMSDGEIYEQEPFFFWSKNNRGGYLGPGVYEIDGSLDEFNDYKSYRVDCRVEYDCDLSFDEVDTFIFDYSRTTQPMLNSLLIADNANVFGLEMMLFTSILEHLFGDQKRSEAACTAIDQLISALGTIDLDENEKNQLISYLNTGKHIGPRSKCQSIAGLYADSSYGGHPTKRIVNEAYNARSSYAHGDVCESSKYPAAPYIKLVVMDVIKNIANKKS